MNSFLLSYILLYTEQTHSHSILSHVPTGRRVVVHKQEGHIESRIAYYLMNMHITPRSIYLTRVCIHNIYSFHQG